MILRHENEFENQTNHPPVMIHQQQPMQKCVIAGGENTAKNDQDATRVFEGLYCSKKREIRLCKEDMEGRWKSNKHGIFWTDHGEGVKYSYDRSNGIITLEPFKANRLDGKMQNAKIDQDEFGMCYISLENIEEKAVAPRTEHAPPPHKAKAVQPPPPSVTHKAKAVPQHLSPKARMMPQPPPPKARMMPQPNVRTVPQRPTASKAMSQHPPKFLPPSAPTAKGAPFPPRRAHPLPKREATDVPRASKVQKHTFTYADKWDTIVQMAIEGRDLHASIYADA
jgi:hypothetical protein